MDDCVGRFLSRFGVLLSVNSLFVLISENQRKFVFPKSSVRLWRTYRDLSAKFNFPQNLIILFIFLFSCYLLLQSHGCVLCAGLRPRTPGGPQVSFPNLFALNERGKDLETFGRGLCGVGDPRTTEVADLRTTDS